MFHDRTDAGEQLAHLVAEAFGGGDPNAIVLGLPRGGVPVAFEVARILELPMDIVVTRKIGIPGREEVAMGAVTATGARIMNERTVSTSGITESQAEESAAAARQEAEEQEHSLRRNRAAPPLHDGTVILIDDGLATGASMRAAVRAVQNENPSRTVVAVPVGAPDSVKNIKSLVDEVLVVETPSSFRAVGEFYERFGQTSTDEVRRLLERARSSGANEPGK